MNKRFILTLQFFSILFGCVNEQRIEHHENGKIKSKVPLVHGLRDGIMTSYYSSGKLLSKHTYRNDSLTGPFEVYFSDGSIAEKGEMRNGKYAGKTHQFYKNGQLHYEHYMLTVNGASRPYYTVEYDSTGRLLSNNKHVDLNIAQNSPETYLVQIRHLEKVRYDSVKLFWGNFDEDFRPNGNLDSIKLQQRFVELTVKPADRQRFFRGYLIRYKDTLRLDTKYHFESYTFFEKEF